MSQEQAKLRFNMLIEQRRAILLQVKAMQDFAAGLKAEAECLAKVANPERIIDSNRERC